MVGLTLRWEVVAKPTSLCHAQHRWVVDGEGEQQVEVGSVGRYRAVVILASETCSVEFGRGSAKVEMKEQEFDAH